MLAPLLLLQLKPRLGVGADELRPVESIRQLRCPVLILSGTADRHTTEAQTRALFAAANEPKELWLVPGASHDDLFRFDETAYAAHVLGFLDRHLAGERARPWSSERPDADDTISIGRALLESFLEAAYVGDWPARLWSVVPGVNDVAITRHSLRLPPGNGQRVSRRLRIGHPRRADHTTLVAREHVRGNSARRAGCPPARRR